MILAIDFDDTIHDTKNKSAGHRLGKPIEGATEALNTLYGNGHKIIIHTIWADSPMRIQAIREWCAYFGIMHHEITNIKPNADVYIDNRGYRFENWQDATAFLAGLTDSETV